jgi:hypothetical protein
MDTQYNLRDADGNARASFYRNQTPYEVNDVTFKSSLYRYNQREQVPLNFIGRKTLRAPTDDSCMFCPRPMDGKWRAEDHIPIMRTQGITPKFQ